MRKAELADAGAIATSHIRSWQAGYANVISGEFLASLDFELEKRTVAWQAHILGAEDDVSFVLVGEIDLQIVGWLGGGPCRDSGEEGQLGEVYGCYVEPDYWRQGVGTALMAAGIDRLARAGYPNAVLWVLADNARARAFYEHHGWQIDGNLKLYEAGARRYPEVRYSRSLA